MVIGIDAQLYCSGYFPPWCRSWPILAASWCRFHVRFDSQGISKIVEHTFLDNIAFRIAFSQDIRAAMFQLAAPISNSWHGGAFSHVALWIYKHCLTFRSA